MPLAPDSSRLQRGTVEVLQGLNILVIPKISLDLENIRYIRIHE